MMSSKKYWLKAFFSILIIWTFFLNGIPVKTQDIVSSDDISGGSSVFVFRQSRPVQSKFAARAVIRRNSSQKAQSRKSVREQVARVIPKRPRNPAVNPNTVAVNQPKNTGKPPRNGTAIAADANAKIKSSEAIAGIGERFLELKMYDKAVETFRAALNDNPKNENARTGLSEALTGKGDAVLEKDGAEAAVKFYEEAGKVNSQNAAAFAALGSAYDDLNNNDSAVQNYEKALAINPNLTELYAPLGTIYNQKGEIAKADEFLTKAVAGRADDSETQYLLGVIRYKQNRNDEAVAALKKSIAVKDSAEARYYLGEVYDRTNRETESLEEYNRAVAINPKYTEAWFDLGAANFNRGRYEDAVAAYEQSIKLKNDNPDAHENLGDVYRLLKQYEKAEGAYNLAVVFAERNNKRATDPKAVAELYSKSGFVQGRRLKWAGAIANLNKAVEMSPDAIDYTNLGWAYYNAAQQDIAIARSPSAQLSEPERVKMQADANAKLVNGKTVLQKAAAMSNSNAGTFMNLGLTLNDLGESQNAVEVFKKALELRKDWVPALNEIGFAYRQLNQLADAVANFRRATELDSKFYPAFYNLAESEFKRGNVKEAKAAQKALRDLNQPGLAKKLDVVFSGAILTNPKQNLENKIKSKIPKLPF